RPTSGPSRLLNQLRAQGTWEASAQHYRGVVCVLRRLPLPTITAETRRTQRTHRDELQMVRTCSRRLVANTAQFWRNSLKKLVGAACIAVQAWSNSTIGSID